MIRLAFDAFLAIMLAICAFYLLYSYTYAPMKRNYDECGRITLCQSS